MAQTSPAQAPPEIMRWAVSVADYHRIREAGILRKDDRVELIDGEERLMSSIGALHAVIVKHYTDPQGEQYATKRTCKRGQTISAQALLGITFAIDAILGIVEK